MALLKSVIIACLLSLAGTLVYSQTLTAVYVNTAEKESAVTSAEVSVKGVAVIIDGHGKVCLRARTGNLSLDYYNRFDNPDLLGQLKTVNGINIKYYDRFDGNEFLGRVKAIGSIEIKYYSRFDGQDNIGKIKSIGDQNITYFDRFDGNDNLGKVKSVGNAKFTYFDRFNGNDVVTGKLKSVSGDAPYLVLDL